MKKKLENLENKTLKLYQYITTVLNIPETPKICIKLKKVESPNTLGDYSFVNKTINIYLLPIITHSQSVVSLLLHELGHHMSYMSIDHKKLLTMPTKKREKLAEKFVNLYYKLFEKEDKEITKLIEEIISIAKKGVK